MKKLVIISLLCIGSLSAMEQSFKFKQSSVRAPQSLGNIELLRNEQGFHVVYDDECYEVKNYFVDPLLRNASKKTLKKFQKTGYVEVKKLDNEDFVLHAKIRGLGGGPVLASILYGATKYLGHSLNTAVGDEIKSVVASTAAATLAGPDSMAVAVTSSPEFGKAITTIVAPIVIEGASCVMGVIGAIIPSI